MKYKVKIKTPNKQPKSAPPALLAPRDAKSVAFVAPWHGRYGAFMVRLLLIVPCLLASQLVSAACREPNTQRDFNSADIVFTGTVKQRIYETCNLSIDEGSRTECSGGELIAKVEIDKIFKDPWDVRTNKTTLVLSGGSVEDVRLRDGGQYLFFGKQISPNIIQVTECGGPASIENAGAKILQLQKISDAFSEDAP